MASAAPVPKPRTNVIDGQSKKPIPKPRQKVVFETPAKSVPWKETDWCVKCDDKGLSECTCQAEHDSKEDTPECSERNKHFVESRKIVGARLEKSMRSLTRRFTSRPLSPGKEGRINGSKILRSHSLPETAMHSIPSEDIFGSITFKSPIASEKENKIPVVSSSDALEENNEFSTYNAPPPIYPPPPLPDESMYDEVQSVVLSGSNSSTVSSSGSAAPQQTNISGGRAYEPIAIDFVASSSINKPSIQEESGVYSNSVVPSISVANSDSWHLYNSGFAKEGSISSSLMPDGRDSTIDERTLSRCSVSPSLLSELDALHCISEDENFDDEVSIRSVSTPRSISVQNDMYDAWEPKDAALDSVTLRKKETERTLPSKSVILEFDPLFARGNSVSQEIQSSNDTGNISQIGMNLTASGEPVYGNIKPVPKVLGSSGKSHAYDEVAIECPPVPPRRGDSMNISVKTSENPAQAAKKHRETLGAVCELSVEEESVQYFSRDQKDSLNKAENSTGLHRVKSSDDVSAEKTAEPRKLNRLASMRNAVRRAAVRTPGTPLLGLRIPMRNAQARNDKQKVEGRENVSKQHFVERPHIPHQVTFYHCGLLYKVAVGREKQQDYVQRWCVLAEDKLAFYADRSATTMKEVISLRSILSIQAVLECKVSVDGDCFEIITPSKSNSFIFGTSGPSERRIWMQKILESLTATFPLRIISDYSRSGWCYLKEGISGKWAAAWILIHRRSFYYCFVKASIQEVDLRKARCVALQDSRQESWALQVSAKGPLVVLDCQGLTLYLCMDTPSETRAWQKIILSAAIDNGPNLDQQQLTKDDIPVIVDKCIKFVYAHGSMSEGIYRRSGSNSAVSNLLEKFRLDAWSVQLSRQEYTEYDVSSVLKRFFRDIPEALLTTELHGQFCDIAAGKFKENKVSLYRKALEQLPPVNFLTTRKLISHLYSIHEQREKNRMPIENLAAIWGPTLMHIETSESLEWSKNETAVVADLLSYHVELFEVDVEELSREKRMQEVLERINASSTSMPQSKPSGEFHVWVYLNSRDSGNCVNITAGPQKLAGDVCTDLAEKMKIPAYELVLQEVVCNGFLTRFLHYSEKILDTVLRWSDWDECDRKEASLVVMKNDELKEVAPLAKLPLTMSGELRFADRKTKAFKPFMFEFSHAKLCYYKDKKGSLKMNEWKVEEIVWYVGYELKKNPQTRWAITFIEKNKPAKRSKECPFFGNTIAGTNNDEYLRWMAALLIGEYPQGLFMSPTLLS